MSKKPRNDEELIEASYHLAYEVFMMRHCQELLCQIQMPPAQSDLVIYNALLDSFLIHARNIIEFIYTEARKAANDHVIAEDYFRENPERWKANCPKKTELLNKTHVAAHQAVAHLSYKRIVNQPYWDWTAVRNDLELIMNEFVKNVATNRIHVALQKSFGNPR